jgi:DNA-binding transcriptional MerR regulator
MANGNGNVEDKFLSIGFMAQACGTTTRAIRFYESRGLIRSSRRARGGGRLFVKSELNKLKLITGLRRSGFPIKTIINLFSIPAESPTAAKAARSVHQTLRDQAREMIELGKMARTLGNDLTQTAELLTHCYECEKPFEEIDCSRCDCCTHVPKDDLPLALRVIWPMKQ